MTFAGGSAGSVDHILAAQIVKAAGADPAKVNYIPFSGGGESIAAILGGKVTAGISGYAEYEGQIKSGKMRAIGISSDKRHAEHRRADAEGTGPRRGDHQLALGRGGARHFRR